MFFVVVFLTILVTCVFFFLKKKHQFWEDCGVPQTNPKPIFGDSYDTLIKGYSNDEFFQKIYDTAPNSRYTGFYQIYFPVLMMKDPELIKQICIKDFDHFTDHVRFISEDVDPMWNKNLFSLQGPKWREMRSTLSPSFTGSKMRMMFTLMQECAENFTAHFGKNTKNKEIIEINLKDAFTRYTNDIIATTAFGIQCDSLQDPQNDFFEMGKQATDLNKTFKSTKFLISLLFPFLSKLLNVSIFNTEISNFFRNLIKETIDYRVKNKITRPDMLNLLLHARKDEIDGTSEKNGKLDLSLDDITSQALIFFFAGFETVSSAMCFLAYELAVNPEIQQKLIEELDEYRKTAKTPTYEGLNQLQFFEMVISETLRKWPVTNSTDRVCTKKYTIQGENPVELQPGTVISIPIGPIHRDAKYWENPDKFDPERFSSENKHKIVPYTYLPFGVGPRGCIGLRFALIEVKVVFYALLEHFEIVPVKRSPIPYKPDPRAVTLTTSNFWFGFKKRN